MKCSVWLGFHTSWWQQHASSNSSWNCCIFRERGSLVVASECDCPAVDGEVNNLMRLRWDLNRVGMGWVLQWCTCRQECRCVKDLHSEWEFMLTALQRSSVGGTPMQIKPRLAPYLAPSQARSLPPTSFLIAQQQFCLISSPASITHLLPIIACTFSYVVLLLLRLFFPLWLFANPYLQQEAFLKWDFFFFIPGR